MIFITEVYGKRFRKMVKKNIKKVSVGDSDLVNDLFWLALERVFWDRHENPTVQRQIYPGDVISVPRMFNLYEHYGVYIGKGRVIHFAGEEGDFGGSVMIRETSLEAFQNGNAYRVCFFPKMQNIPGYHLYSSKETVYRAKACLGKAGYDLLRNNCEHFAFWCKTGIKESAQVNAILKIIRG